MRIGIADDEYLIQESLKSMIAELSPDWKIVGTASDGEELIGLIHNERPDVTIVDIKMPKKSGLEAILEIRNDYPGMNWLVLSGYSEFAYAQEALRLGASQYLLKPVDIHELQVALVKLEKGLIHRNQVENMKFGSWLTSMCHGLNPDPLWDEVPVHDEQEVRMFVFYTEGGLEEAEKSKVLSGCYDLITATFQEKLRLCFNIRSAFVFLPTGELAWVVAGDRSSHYGKLLNSIRSEMESIIQDASANGGFCLTLMMEECSSVFKIKEKLEQLQGVSVLRICLGVNRVWTARELGKESNEDRMKLCRVVLRIIRCFEEGSFALYINAVREFKMLSAQTDLLQNRRIRTSVMEYLRLMIGCRLETEDSAAVWAERLEEYGTKRLNLETPKSQRPMDILQRTLLYIENHYMKELSIMEIAEELRVTPNYLSTLFHKKMEITFVKYLNKIRLTKAQELLKDPNAQVQTVAEKVGYYNPRYFAKLFTDMFGCNPSDYMKQHRMSPGSSGGLPTEGG